MDRTLTAFSALVLATLPLATAHADNDDARRELASQFYGYKMETHRLDRERTLEAAYPIDGCDALIAKAHAAGLGDDAKLEIGADTKTLGDMPALCKEFRAQHLVAEATVAILAANADLAWMSRIEYEEGNDENAPRLIANAKACNDVLDQLAALGVRSTAEVMLGREKGKPITVTIADAKAKVCAPAAKAAASFAKDVEKARKAKEERIAAPYKKAGITGDRLDLCVRYDDSAIQGVGGGELTTPAQLKKAKLLFVTLGPSSDDGTWTVTRYVFSGDKIVSHKDTKYVLEPGPKAYR